MKTLGVLLILSGALGGYLSYRRCSIQTLNLARALSDDLSVLRCQICTHRKTLPSVLLSDLKYGAGSVSFWNPLRTLLEQSEHSLHVCWETASMNLPEPLGRCISSMGVLLPAGGDVLARVIDETRRELMEFADSQQKQQSQKLRLAAAMCFSSAALFILMFI